MYHKAAVRYPEIFGIALSAFSEVFSVAYDKLTQKTQEQE